MQWSCPSLPTESISEFIILFPNKVKIYFLFWRYMHVVPPNFTSWHKKGDQNRQQVKLPNPLINAAYTIQVKFSFYIKLDNIYFDVVITIFLCIYRYMYWDIRSKTGNFYETEWYIIHQVFNLFSIFLIGR